MSIKSLFIKCQCGLGIHKWVLYKKNLHQFQPLNSLRPYIDFHYGCNGCGKTKVESRNEGFWATFRSDHLNHDIGGKS